MNSEIDFNKKAQEITYVLMRIGFSMRRAAFRARIERLALDLFESVALHEFERSLSLIAALEGFIQVGVSLYEIETVNAQSLLHELSAMQSAIRQKYIADESPHFADESAIGNVISAESAKESAISENVEDASEVEPSDDGMVSIASTIRQSAILGKVREMTSRNESSFVSGCRMKDLLSAFPQVSERTLRYDLQSLLGRGAIERLGSGGSNSFYVIK